MPSALFLRMATSPEVRESEARVLHYFRYERGMDVIDCRDQHRAYDFLLAYAPDVFGTLDVKLQTTSCRSGNFSWEVEKVWYNRGNVEPGWGMKEDMDYVCYVQPWQDREWEGYLFDAKKLRLWMPRHHTRSMRQGDTDNHSTIHLAPISLMMKGDAYLERFNLPPAT